MGSTTTTTSTYRYNPASFVASFRTLEEKVRKTLADETMESVVLTTTASSSNTSQAPPSSPCPAVAGDANNRRNCIRVAAVQLRTMPSSSFSHQDGDAGGTITGDAEAFMDRAILAVKEAVSIHGANLVLIQELFLGPYFCQSQDERLFELALDLKDLPSDLGGCSSEQRRYDKLSPNVFLAAMQVLAKTLHVVLPVSVFERCNNAYYNTVVMVDADGCIVGKYRKSHIPDGTGYQEKFYFSPGDTGFRVFDTKVGRIGVGICWDQWFPECARSMALMGADVLLYPTAIGSEPQNPALDSSDHWQRTMQGHAAANMIPVVASNRFGTEILMNDNGTEERQRITFYGRSFITDETGAIVVEAKSGEGDVHDIIVSDIDPIKNRATRSAWGLFRDRRPELYGVLKTKDGMNRMYDV